MGENLHTCPFRDIQLAKWCLCALKRKPTRSVFVTIMSLASQTLMDSASIPWIDNEVKLVESFRKSTNALQPTEGHKHRHVVLVANAPVQSTQIKWGILAERTIHAGMAAAAYLALGFERSVLVIVMLFTPATLKRFHERSRRCVRKMEA